jgi:hypothetical protein
MKITNQVFICPTHKEILIHKLNYNNNKLYCPKSNYCCNLYIKSNKISCYDIRFGDYTIFNSSSDINTNLYKNNPWTFILSMPFIPINNQQDLDNLLPKLLKLKAFI